MTREEYKESILNELSTMTKEELERYAKEHGLNVYSHVPCSMMYSIAECMTSRLFTDAYKPRIPIKYSGDKTIHIDLVLNIDKDWDMEMVTDAIREMVQEEVDVVSISCREEKCGDKGTV